MTVPLFVTLNRIILCVGIITISLDSVSVPSLCRNITNVSLFCVFTCNTTLCHCSHYVSLLSLCITSLCHYSHFSLYHYFHCVLLVFIINLTLLCMNTLSYHSPCISLPCITFSMLYHYFVSLLLLCIPTLSH